MNDDVPTDHDRRDDDKRNVTLDDDFVTSATANEGSAEEGSAPAPKRVWPRNTALAVAAAVATFLVLRYTGSSADEAAAPESTASAHAPSAAAAALLPWHGR